MKEEEIKAISIIAVVISTAIPMAFATYTATRMRSILPKLDRFLIIIIVLLFCAMTMQVLCSCYTCYSSFRFDDDSEQEPEKVRNARLGITLAKSVTQSFVFHVYVFRIMARLAAYSNL